MRYLSRTSRQPSFKATRVAAQPNSQETGRRPPLLPALGLVAVLVVALVIFVLPGGSGAKMVSETVNPDNVWTSGILRLVNSTGGGLVLDASGLAPDQSAQGTLTLTCQGDLPATVSLVNGGVNDTPASPALSDTLELLVEDITLAPQALYEGTLGAFGNVPLGALSTGETRAYRFTVTFPAKQAVPALQGASATMLFVFVGTTQ